MPSLVLFDDKGLKRVCEALQVAEDRVSDYYWLTQTSWRRYAYEVKTLAQLDRKQISDRALAQVLRFRQPPSRDGYRSRDFFRICLQDQNILRRTAGQGNPELLFPLLVYILAHELVHIVRFYRFQHLFETTLDQIALEEARVHGITTELLQGVSLPGLNGIIEGFDSMGGDEILSAA